MHMACTNAAIWYAPTCRRCYEKSETSQPTSTPAKRDRTGPWNARRVVLLIVKIPTGGQAIGATCRQSSTQTENENAQQRQCHKKALNCGPSLLRNIGDARGQQNAEAVGAWDQHMWKRQSKNQRLREKKEPAGNAVFGVSCPGALAWRIISQI